MCWVSWKKLTFPKNAGGLGFRDIEVFNDSLLPKQSWRLLRNPSSLIARVLLGKYCHTTPFMECSLPSWPSHGWRSILVGCGVLRKGLGWTIGTGEDAKVWSHPWLSMDSPLCPMGPPPLSSKDMLVSDLIDSNTRQWNLRQIREHLPEFEEPIRLLPLWNTRRKDKQVWLLLKHGEYTTRSGYGVSVIQDIPLLHIQFNWQKHVWKVQTLPKIKSFIWKALVRALPMGILLLHRGIDIDANCKCCGSP